MAVANVAVPRQPDDSVASGSKKSLKKKNKKKKKKNKKKQRKIPETLCDTPSSCSGLSTPPSDDIPSSSSDVSPMTVDCSDFEMGNQENEDEEEEDEVRLSRSASILTIP